jgi:ferredoxin--NADP+ reductase
MDILRAFAAREPEGKPRLIRLRFLASPVAFHGSERVESVEVVRNELSAGSDGRISAVATDERETITANVVFRSVGYHGVPLAELPFDERSGTMPNDGGRVLGADRAPLPGVYAAGWIKRGPTGVIGTNKKDATETVSLLLEDARSGRLPAPPRGSADALVDLLAERGIEPVLYTGWEAIDVVEKAAGEPHGRPRVKLVSWEELLSAARGAAAAKA